jgi:hypothetical protein
MAATNNKNKTIRAWYVYLFYSNVYLQSSQNLLAHSYIFLHY